MSGCEEGEGESGIDSISGIVLFLKSAFRDVDYEKAERMLKLREEKLILAKNAVETELKERTKELMELGKEVVETVEKLEISQTMCSQLTTELEKRSNDYCEIVMEQGDLEFQNTSLLEEVNVYKRRCDALKEQITHLEKVDEFASERERENEEKDVALANLERENMELVMAKSRGERETEAWKKRYKKLEARVSQLEKEYVEIKQMGEWLVGKQEVEPESFIVEKFHVEGTYRHDGEMRKTKYGANNGIKVCLSSSRSKEKSCDNEEIPASSKAIHTSTNRKGCPDEAGCPSSTKSCNPFLRIKEMERCISSEFDLGSRCRTGKELVLELECSSKKPCTPKMDVETPAIGDTIDISDSDGEAEITPKYTSKDGVDCNMDFAPMENAEKGTTEDVEETTPQTWVTPNPSTCFPSAKRSRGLDPAKATKNMDLNCDDEISFGKHKRKKLLDLTDGIKNPTSSQVRNSFIAPVTPLEDKNAKLGQPFSQLKLCKEKSSNILVKNGTFPESGIPASWDADKAVSLEKTVNTAQDDDLDSGNSSDNSADACTDGSAISQVLSFIKMNKPKKVKMAI